MFQFGRTLLILTAPLSDMGFDCSHLEWPLVIIEASGESSDKDMDSYLATLEAALARQERHIIIVDATRGQNLKGTHRRRVAEWNKKNEAALKKYRAGLVLVTENSVLRGLITAVYWLFAPPFPYKAADTVDEARRWGRLQLNHLSRKSG